MGEVGPEEDDTLDLEELHRLLDEKWSGLMDVNHDGMQFARKVVHAINIIQEEFNDHCDELKSMLILKAAAFARVAEDLIMAEFDATTEEVDEEEDEEE